MTVAGVVTGTGHGQVAGGTLKIASTASFNENVGFSGTGGTLELAHGRAYSGALTGFSLTATTALELDDITFISGTTKASYAGTATAGVLTITSGAQVAHIHFNGNYLASTWTLSAGPGGGTKIVDPASPPAAASGASPSMPRPTHPFVQAMAGIGARGDVSAGHGVDVWQTAPPMLAKP